MTKVQLNTAWPPTGAKGEIENHYGVPFTIVETKEKDAKGALVKVLQTELDDEEAKLMVDAGRVTVIKVPETPKAPAAPPAGDAK